MYSENQTAAGSLFRKVYALVQSEYWLLCGGSPWIKVLSVIGQWTKERPWINVNYPLFSDSKGGVTWANLQHQFFAQCYCAIFVSIFFDLLHEDNFLCNIHFLAHSLRYDICFSFVLASINAVSTSKGFIVYVSIIVDNFCSFNLLHEDFFVQLPPFCCTWSWPLTCYMRWFEAN